MMSEEKSFFYKYAQTQDYYLAARRSRRVAMRATACAAARCGKYQVPGTVLKRVGCGRFFIRVRLPSSS